MQTEHLDSVVRRVLDVCRATAPAGLIGDLRRYFAAAGLSAAVTRRDTPMLFEWLARVLAFQGVSNAIAANYLDQHGTISFDDIATAMSAARRSG